MRRMREMPEKFHIIVDEPEMVNVCFWYVLVSCPTGQPSLGYLLYFNIQRTKEFSITMIC